MGGANPNQRGVARRWTSEEEKDLRVLVEDLGTGKWSHVAERLGSGRTASGVEQHWQIMTGQRKRNGKNPQFREGGGGTSGGVGVGVPVAAPPAHHLPPTPPPQATAQGGFYDHHPQGRGGGLPQYTNHHLSAVQHASMGHPPPQQHASMGHPPPSSYHHGGYPTSSMMQPPPVAASHHVQHRYPPAPMYAPPPLPPQQHLPSHPYPAMMQHQHPTHRDVAASQRNQHVVGPTPQMVAAMASSSRLGGPAPPASLVRGMPSERGVAHRWTVDEESRLRALVGEIGKNKWAVIAESLGTGRSASGVEQHWQIMIGQRKRNSSAKTSLRPSTTATTTTANSAALIMNAHAPAARPPLMTATLGGGSGAPLTSGAAGDHHHGGDHNGGGGHHQRRHHREAASDAEQDATDGLLMMPPATTMANGDYDDHKADTTKLLGAPDLPRREDYPHHLEHQLPGRTPPAPTGDYIY